MIPERWHRITRVLDHVASYPPSERQGNFDEVCDKDADFLPDLQAFLGLDDRLEILGLLGKGGFGYVFKIYDSQLRSEVALKTLRRLEPDALRRFKKEFRAMIEVQHPNLVQLYELFSVETEGLGTRWYITMELVRGKNFIQWARSSDPRSTITTAAPPAGHPTPSAYRASLSQLAATESLLEALRQLVEAVATLHDKGLLHRDIKPSNIRVTPEGQVKLLDFGLVKKLTPDTGNASATSIVGTPAYMAPEQAEGRTVDKASDWYAVGLVLYEVLTGERPFSRDQHGKPLREPLEPSCLNPSVPADLDRLCLRLLARDPQDRPTGRQVLKHLGCVGPQDRGDVADGVPFVGREDELGALSKYVDKTREGKAVVVFVSGKQGFGKTSLIDHFIKNIRQKRKDTVVLEARCYERETGPYKGLDPLIDALSQYLHRLPDSEAQALLPENMPALVRLFPVLKSLEPRTGSGRMTSTDPREQQRQARQAFRELLRRLATAHSTLLYLEDLQWGDSDSAKFLTHVLSHPDPPAISLITCYPSDEVLGRPHLRKLFDSIPHLDRTEVCSLEVGRLPTLDICRLGRELLGSAPRAAMMLARRSGGSPLFMSELAHYARSSLGGRLPKPDEITLENMIWNKLENLTHPARQLLNTFSVAGHPIPLKIAMEVASPSTAVHSAVAELRGKNLIRTSRDRLQEFEISHNTTRQIATQGLDPETLRKLHRQLAMALQAARGTPVETLASHFHAAGDHDRATDLTLAAAQNASDKLAFDRAAKLYQLAVERRYGDLTTQHRLRVSLGDALAKSGRNPEAAEAYYAASLKAEGVEALELRRRTAIQQLLGGNPCAFATIQELLSSTGIELPDTRFGQTTYLLLRRLYLRLRGLRFKERPATRIPERQLFQIDALWAGAGTAIEPLRWLDLATRHLLLALQTGEPSRIVRALLHEVFISAMRGSRSRRRTGRLIQLGLRLAKRVEDPYSLGLANEAAGIGAYFEGRWRRAGERFDRASGYLRKSLVDWDLAWVITWQMEILMWRGQIKELRNRLPELLEDVAQRGGVFAEILLRSHAAWLVYLAADKPHEASRELARAGSLIPQKMDYFITNYFQLSGIVEISLYKGEETFAWQHLQEAWLKLERSHILRLELTRLEAIQLRCRGALAAAKTLKDSTLRDEAFLKVRECIRDIAAQDLIFSAPFAELLRAGLQSIKGRIGKALIHLNNADEGFESADMELYAAVSQRRRGQLLGFEKGQRLVESADRWMSGQGIVRPDRIADVLAPGNWDAG